MRRRGWTLFETLVAMTLAAGLTTLMLYIWMSVTRASAPLSVQADLDSAASLALRWLVLDLEKAVPASTQCKTCGDAHYREVLCLTPLADVSVEGTSVWANSCIVYVWNQAAGRLLRKTWPPEPPTLSLTFRTTAPPHLIDPQLEALGSQSNGLERTIASRVVDFQVGNRGATGEIRDPVELSLTLEDKTLGRALRATLTRSYSFRNGGNHQQ